jgi:hypothetical protein
MRNEAIKETGKNLQALANLILGVSLINIYLNSADSLGILLMIPMISIGLYVIGFKLIQRGSS